MGRNEPSFTFRRIACKAVFQTNPESARSKLARALVFASARDAACDADAIISVPGTTALDPTASPAKPVGSAVAFLLGETAS